MFHAVKMCLVPLAGSFCPSVIIDVNSAVQKKFTSLSTALLLAQFNHNKVVYRGNRNPPLFHLFAYASGPSAA